MLNKVTVSFIKGYMQKLYTMFAGRFSLLFLFILLCSSCSDDCKGIDCQSQNAFEFTIKSETSGNDMLFGSNPQLSEKDIEVFYIKDGVEKTSHVHLGTRSVIVSLEDDVEEYHVRALDETDVINIQSQRISSTECCPATIRIEEIRVNGDVVTEDTGIIILLR
jgi:hypothetical protein